MSVKKWIQHLSSDIIFDIFVYEILVLAHTTTTCFLFLLFHQFFLLLTIGRFGYFVHKQSHSSQRSANKKEFISYCRSWSFVMTLWPLEGLYRLEIYSTYRNLRRTSALLSSLIRSSNVFNVESEPVSSSLPSLLDTLSLRTFAFAPWSCRALLEGRFLR